MKTYRVFLDSSVLIAGVGSARGGSRQILDWCAERLLVPVTSSQVLVEVRRNVAKKLPRAVGALERIIEALDPELASEPSESDVADAAKLVPRKDAAILAPPGTRGSTYF